ncbi:hypothetical protein K439DRAFT_1341111, partial [Ramaria rubella]
AEIRIYSPCTECPLPDGTVVNLYGRLFAPSNGTFLINGISMVSFPGYLSNKTEYESFVLDDMTIKVWAVGAVLNQAEQWMDGSSRIFNMAVSEYVCDRN